MEQITQEAFNTKFNIKGLPSCDDVYKMSISNLSERVNFRYVCMRCGDKANDMYTGVGTCKLYGCCKKSSCAEVVRCMVNRLENTVYFDKIMIRIKRSNGTIEDGWRSYLLLLNDFNVQCENMATIKMVSLKDVCKLNPNIKINISGRPSAVKMIVADESAKLGLEKFFIF